MSNLRRIDFTLFQEARKENVSGGRISGSLKQMMSNGPALESVLKLLEPVCCIYWVSEGDWSMHELLLGILNITGPAKVHISSYAFSETASRVLAQLKEAGTIDKLYCVLDSRVDVRTAGSLQLLKAVCDKCVLVDTHAKVTVIQNEIWNIVVIGSANYTENKRYEAGILTENEVAVNMHLKWITKALCDGME